MSSLRLTRRALLRLAPGTLLALSCLSVSKAESRLVVTDPKCPPEAFAEILENFRNLRKSQKPISDEQRLRDGRAWLAGQPVEDLSEGETASWVQVPSTGGSTVKARVLRPAGTLKGVVLSIHGGGWAMGTAISDEKRHWAWARQARVAVVSPDYRLAPEFPFPAAPDDCEAVARWLIREAPAQFGTSRLAISGGSAGGHLAVLSLQRLEPPLRSAFSCALLYYGVYDLGRSEVWRNSTDLDFPDLSPSDMDLFLGWFVPQKSDQQRRDARYSPLYGDLSDMPPALFLVGGADLLADDTRRLARRWVEQGVAAELVEYPGAPHGFNGFGVDCGLNPDTYAGQFLLKSLG